MKRIFLPVFTVFVILLSSCVSQTGNPFSVFYADFTAEMTLRCEESECTLKYTRADKTLSFLSPDELSGYKMRLDGDTAYLYFEDTEIQLSEYASRTAFLLDADFSQNRENITEISVKKYDNAAVTEVKSQSFTYSFSADGAPVAVVGEFEGVTFKLSFSSFTGEIQ